MPKDYIVRLVFDPRHKSMVVSRNKRVVGGITYRPFYEQKMAEIAFCAVMSSEQVRCMQGLFAYTPKGVVSELDCFCCAACLPSGQRIRISSNDTLEATHSYS